MENPASWGPLEKAVSLALGHIAMGCANDADPSLDVRASWIADHLARHAAIKPDDQASAAKAIETSLKTRLANPMPMISETKQIADALRAAGLGT